MISRKCFAHSRTRPGGGAVVAVLVDVPFALRRLERQDRVEEPDVLADEVLADERDVLLRPPFVLRELPPQPLPFVEIGVAPEVHHLVERADLGQPVALQLPVVVAADCAADLARVLRHGRSAAGPQGVGPKLVDHVFFSRMDTHGRRGPLPRAAGPAARNATAYRSGGPGSAREAAGTARTLYGGDGRERNCGAMAVTVEAGGTERAAERRGAARAVAVVSSAHFTSHFYLLLLPPLFPLLREAYGVGYTELGFAISVFSIVTACTQVAGRLRGGPVRGAADPRRRPAARRGRVRPHRARAVLRRARRPDGGGGTRQRGIPPGRLRPAQCLGEPASHGPRVLLPYRGRDARQRGRAGDHGVPDGVHGLAHGARSLRRPRHRGRAAGSPQRAAC